MWPKCLQTLQRILLVQLGRECPSIGSEHRKNVGLGRPPQFCAETCLAHSDFFENPMIPLSLGRYCWGEVKTAETELWALTMWLELDLDKNLSWFSECIGTALGIWIESKETRFLDDISMGSSISRYWNNCPILIGRLLITKKISAQVWITSSP